MKTCEYAGDPLLDPRSHPWTDSVASPECRYYDLTREPEHIRTSLEDFQPWGRYPAVQDFYSLLEWMNQPGSTLESNDCAFEGPCANANLSISKALVCTGRLMLLFRALDRNTVPGNLEQLTGELHCRLVVHDPDFEWGVIGTTLIPVRYLALAGRRERSLGAQLMISFWAWGNTERECMANLQRLFKNLSQALLDVSSGRIKSG